MARQDEGCERLDCYWPADSCEAKRQTRAQVDPPATAPDYAELRALAEKATPGPWFVVGQPWNQGPSFVNAGSEDPHQGWVVCDSAASFAEPEEFEAWERDAAFIAACSPDVVIALIEAVAVPNDLRTTPSGVSEIEALQAELLALRAARDKAERERAQEKHDRLAQRFNSDVSYAKLLGALKECALARDKAERALRGAQKIVEAARALYESPISHFDDVLWDALGEALGGSGAASSAGES